MPLLMAEAACRVPHWAMLSAWTVGLGAVSTISTRLLLELLHSIHRAIGQAHRQHIV